MRGPYEGRRRRRPPSGGPASPDRRIPDSPLSAAVGSVTGWLLRIRSRRSRRPCGPGSSRRSPSATPPQAQGWPAIASGEHTLILAPTGSGKTLSAFLWGIDTLVSRPAPGRAHPPHPAALRLAAAGAGRRRREEPAQPAAGDPPGRRAPRRALHGAHGRHAHRRHPGRRAAPARAQPARHPDHHARVALPDAHLGGAGDAAGRRGRDHRRDPRAGRHQARQPPRPHPRAPRPLGHAPGGDARRSAAETGAERRSERQSSGSGCRPRSGRWRRSPGSSAAPSVDRPASAGRGRSPSSTPGCASRSRSRWSSRSTTWRSSAR